MAAKTRPNRWKNTPLSFSNKKGFWLSVIVGAIVGGIGSIIGIFSFLAWLVITMFILTLMWYSYEGIKKDTKNGDYKMFVTMVIAWGGILVGALLLWLATKPRVFRYFMVMMTAFTLAILGFWISIQLGGGNTIIYTLGPTSNFTSAQSYSLCNNDTYLAGTLFVIPNNYAVASTYCSGSIIYMRAEKI